MFERFFERLRSLYERTLRLAMKHRRVTLGIALATFVATVVLFVVIPKGFFPDEDTNQIFCITEGAQDISFEAMKAHQQEAAKIVAANTNVAAFMSAIGLGGSTISGNNGRIFMRLKDRSERKQSAGEIIQDLRKQFAQIPGFNVFPQIPAAHPRRRHADQGAVSIQPAGHRHAGTVHQRTPVLVQQNRGAEGHFSGRDERFADRQPAGGRGH